MAVGGRRAHPTRAEKNHHEKINIKERRFAIRSAVAATANKELVESRGHRLGDLEQVPIIVEDDICSVKTTKQTREIFQNLGVYDDITRAKEGKRIRAGRGKTRGRKYKKVKGPLLVVGEDNGIKLGARNHAGYIQCIVIHNCATDFIAIGYCIFRKYRCYATTRRLLPSFCICPRRVQFTLI